MPVIHKNISSRFRQYEQAGPKERYYLLQALFESVQDLPITGVDKNQTATTLETMKNAIRMCIFVQQRTAIESKKNFDINPIYNDMHKYLDTDKYEPLKEYFEVCDGRMSLDEPIAFIPNESWVLFQEMQTEHLKKVLKIDSVDLSEYDIFYPNNEPYLIEDVQKALGSIWNNEKYVDFRKELLKVAKEAQAKEQKAEEQRLDDLIESQQKLDKLYNSAGCTSTVRALLKKMNAQIGDLVNQGQVHRDKLRFAVVLTSELVTSMMDDSLKKKSKIQPLASEELKQNQTQLDKAYKDYEELANSMHGSASPGLRRLGKTMLALFAVVIALGVTAVITPEIALATAAITAVSAIGFFAFGRQTGISAIMSQLLAEKKRGPAYEPPENRESSHAAL